MRFVAIALVAFSVVAGPAAADERGEAAFRSFLETIGGWDGWTVTAGTIGSEGIDTVVSDFAAKRSDPAVSVAVARFRLRDLAPAAGGFSASEAELSGISVTADGLEITVPRLAAKDMAMPDFADLAFTPGAFFGFRASLYRELEAARLAELSVPQMTLALRDAAGHGTALDYTNVRLGPLADGILVGAAAGPVRITSLDPAARGGIAIASAKMGEADLSAFADLFSEDAGSAAANPWRPALRDVRYNGIVANDGDADRFAVDEVALEDLETRIPAEPLAPRLDALVRGKKEDEAFDTILKTLDALRVGAVRINGVALKDEPGEPVDIGLDALALAELSGDGFSSLDLRNMRVVVPGAYVAMAGVGATGVRFPTLSEAPDVDAFWAEAPAAEREAAVKRLLASLGQIDRLEANGLAVGTSKAESVTLERMTVDMAGHIGALPTSTSVTVEGLAVPSEFWKSRKGGEQLLAVLGEDRLEIDISLDETWKPSAGTDSVALALSLNDAATMRFAYSYSGITEAWLYTAIARAAKVKDGDFDAALRVLQGLTLDTASLRFDDTSLLDRGFAYAAKRQGLTIDGPTYRQQMRGALPFLISAALPAELSRLLIEPLQAFLGGGQTLVVSTDLASPLPLTTIANSVEKDPKDLVSLMNVKVSAVPAP